MAGSERLYTPELLGLAVTLGDYPLDDDLLLRGEARSRSCGSTLEVGLSLDGKGQIERLGLRVRACAVGQAAAAIFALAAPGHSADEVARAHRDLAAWLAGEGAAPDWPGIATLGEARGFPARHGAIMLPWTAALAALSTHSHRS